MELTLVITLALAVLAYELPALIKARMWRETLAFLILYVMGVFLAVAQVLDIKLPNPVLFIDALFRPISTWVDKTLS